MKKKLTILLWACLQVLFLAAQPAQINVRKIGNESGLFTSSITDMLQDSKGFLWVISSNKIQRYDGKYTRFFFTHEGGKTPIMGIAEDRSGHVWVTSSKYVYKYENEYDGFKKCSDTSGPARQKLKMITNDDNQVFILCRNGILSVDENTNTLKTLPLVFTIGNSSYYPFYAFRNSLFFSNEKMVYRYQLQKNQLDSVPFAATRLMAFLNEDSVWVGNTKLESALLSFSTQTVAPVLAKQFDKKFATPNIFISESYPVSDNYLFTIIRYKGFFLFNKKNNQFKEIKVYDKGVELQNYEQWTNGVHKAKNGVNFMPMSNALYYIIPEDRSFGFFNPAGTNSSNEASSVLRNFAEDPDNNLWMATSNGFIKWNRLSGQIKNYYPHPGADNYLNFASVRGIAFNKNKLLIGQSDGGLWVFDPARETFTRPVYPPGIHGDSVKRWSETDFISSVYSLKNGDYLVASNHYIKRISGSDNSIDLVHFSGIKNINFTRIIYEDRQSRLWFLGTEGIYVTDSTCKFLGHITNPKLNGSYLNAIEQVTDSTFWVGWEGMYEVTLKKNNSLTIEPVFSNLENLIIYNLFKDSAGYYWATCDEGIYRLQQDKKSYRLYDQGNNVLNNQYSPARTFRSRDGNIYLPGYIGVTYFTPEKLSGEEYPLYTLITSAKINENNSLFFLNNTGHLNYNQNSIEINYIAPYAYNGPKVMYRYLLEGADEEWVNTGNNTFVRFSSLSPGSYTFRVAASLNGKDWFEATTPFIFKINPPFWKTWWFRLISALLIGYFVFYFSRDRINKIKQRETFKRDYERKIAEVEMQALRAQMNPHFMFNSLNSINNFILKNDSDNASGYLTKFSRLMRLILDNSRSEWVLLENELKALELYIELEAVRFDNAFNYMIEVTQDISVETVMVPPLLIQPYVENAIWHGLLHRKEPGGKLDIRLWKNDDKLYIEIEDNGVGRDEAKRLKSKSATLQKSHGMKITAERMDIVNKVYNVNAGVIITDLKDTDQKQNGTRVLITLKYKTHESDHSG